MCTFVMNFKLAFEKVYTRHMIVMQWGTSLLDNKILTQSLGTLVQISHLPLMLVPKFSNWTCLKAQVIFKINTSCHKILWELSNMTYQTSTKFG